MSAFLEGFSNELTKLAENEAATAHAVSGGVGKALLGSLIGAAMLGKGKRLKGGVGGAAVGGLIGALTGGAKGAMIDDLMKDHGGGGGKSFKRDPNKKTWI